MWRGICQDAAKVNRKYIVSAIFYDLRLAMSCNTSIDQQTLSKPTNSRLSRLAMFDEALKHLTRGEVLSYKKLTL
jgi:hypothetical protein